MLDWIGNYLKVGKMRDGNGVGQLQQNAMSCFNTARCIGGTTPGLRCCPTTPQDPPNNCEEATSTDAKSRCGGGGVCTEYKPVTTAFSSDTTVMRNSGVGGDLCTGD